MTSEQVFQLRQNDDDFILTIKESVPGSVLEPSIVHFQFNRNSLDDLRSEIDRVVPDEVEAELIRGLGERIAFFQADNKALNAEIVRLQDSLHHVRLRKDFLESEVVKLQARPMPIPGEPVRLNRDGSYSPVLTGDHIGKLEADRDDARREAKGWKEACREDRQKLRDALALIDTQDARLKVAETDRAVLPRKGDARALVALRQIAEVLKVVPDKKGRWLESVVNVVTNGEAVHRNSFASIRRLQDHNDSLLDWTRNFFQGLNARLGLKLDGKTLDFDAAAAQVLAAIDAHREQVRTLTARVDRVTADMIDNRTAWKLQDEKLRMILGIPVGDSLPEAIRSLQERVARPSNDTELAQVLGEVARLLGVEAGIPAIEIPRLVERSLQAGRMVRSPNFADLQDESDLDESDLDEETRMTLHGLLDATGCPFAPDASLRAKVEAVCAEVNDRQTLFASITSLLRSKGVNWGPDAIRNLIEEWDDLRRLRDGVGQMVGATDPKSIPAIFAAVSRLVTAPQREAIAAHNGAHDPAATLRPIRPRAIWRFRRGAEGKSDMTYKFVAAEDYVAARRAVRQEAEPGTWVHDPASTDEQERRNNSPSSPGEWGPIQIP